MASSTASPQPSLTDGKARASALRYQCGQLGVADRAGEDHVPAQVQPEVGQHGKGVVPILGVILERVATHHHQGRRGIELAGQDGHGLEQERAALPRFDTTDRQEDESIVDSRGSPDGRAAAGAMAGNRVPSTPL